MFLCLWVLPVGVPCDMVQLHNRSSLVLQLDKLLWLALSKDPGQLYLGPTSMHAQGITDAYTHVYTHTHMHTSAHTHTHTHTHTYTHTGTTSCTMCATPLTGWK